MRDLVYHGVADDLGLPAGRDGHPLDRSAEDADSIGKVWLLRAARRERHTLIQTEERAPFRNSLARRLVLYHDLQIPNALAELRGQLIQSVAHEAREARTPQIGHVRTLRSRGAGRSHAGERTRAQAADTGLG